MLIHVLSALEGAQMCFEWGISVMWPRLYIEAGGQVYPPIHTVIVVA